MQEHHQNRQPQDLATICHALAMLYFILMDIPKVSVPPPMIGHLMNTPNVCINLSPTRSEKITEYLQKHYFIDVTLIMRVSDWCLTPSQLFFCYNMARTSYFHYESQ